MTQRESFFGQVGGRLIALATLGLLAVTFFSFRQFSAARVVEAQARRQQRKTRPKAGAQSKTAILVSNFKHEDHRLPKADRTCSDCHAILTPAVPDVVAAKIKPSVKGYPYHDKCLDCHRVTPPQMFRGTTPVICAVCHTRSSPRLIKSDMNPFPRQSAQTILGDLSVKFDHESTSHRRGCTTCHINIAQLDMAKADVQISNCASSTCHRKPNVKPGFDQEMLLLEDDDIAGGKNLHPCVGCHLTSIGGTPPPCTHYKLFDGDRTYFNSTDFPKGAKLISAQCK